MRKCTRQPETCRTCGGTVKVVACIEDSVVIKKTMTHQVDTAEQPQEQGRDLGVGVLGV